ncbi:MAG: formate dehydrogenase [Desulfovibrio sp.]|nr:MAG: formate dehydrogenase [Desulfovibrio sp.]
MAKGFFIDLSVCTACRGCQVACKQWKKLPAEQTHNWGSHQNPADLSYNTLKLVRFEETVVDGELKWLFFPDQCRHCLVPPCKDIGDLDAEGAVLKDEATGAVVFTEKTADLGYPEDVRDACPYDIPRQAPDSSAMSKCDMCIDRVQNGMLPACVLSCPTGAMNFGDLDEMRAMAEARLAEVKATNPNAMLADPNDVQVIYLTEYDPALYSYNAVADASPRLINRKSLLAKLFRPLKRSLT